MSEKLDLVKLENELLAIYNENEKKPNKFVENKLREVIEHDED